GQRWEDVAWGIDYISPMAYPSHYAPRVYGLPDPDAAPYETVLATLTDALERRPHGEPAVIRPWLQDFSLRHHYGPAEVRAQIQAVYDAGLEQWLLWNPGARYTEAALEPAG
ncbi:MAG TPA: putative glycoside hydrolase, partial [Bacillota bacterium]